MSTPASDSTPGPASDPEAVGASSAGASASDPLSPSGASGSKFASGPLDDEKQMTMIVYALQGASLIVGITFLVAVIVNYVKRDEVKGTWLESHFEWQIKTFWYTVLYGVIGGITAFVLIGIPILLVGGIWTIYRIVKGFIRLNEDEPMYVDG